MKENIYNIIKEIREKIKNNPKYLHPCNKEFQEDIKRFEFKNGNEFIGWMQQNGIIKNPANIHMMIKKETIKNSGCKTNKEYLDRCAKKAGYKDYNEIHTEYERHRRWNKCENSPMSENEECSLYQGIHIVERRLGKIILEMIFENIKEMPIMHPEFDYTCKNPRQEFIIKYPQLRLETDKEYKINVKSSRLRIHNASDTFKYWSFGTKFNAKPDYFLLVGLNDWPKENIKNIIHIWFFKKDEIIRGRKFYNVQGFAIYNNPKRLIDFTRFEIRDELEYINDVCKEVLENV